MSYTCWSDCHFTGVDQDPRKEPLRGFCSYFLLTNSGCQEHSVKCVNVLVTRAMSQVGSGVANALDAEKGLIFEMQALTQPFCILALESQINWIWWCCFSSHPFSRLKKWGQWNSGMGSCHEGKLPCQNQYQSKWFIRRVCLPFFVFTLLTFCWVFLVQASFQQL